jgi:phosphoribosylaminoimidazole-succinocarboxamide synthase
MNATAQKEISLPLFIRGKVRDVYDLGGQLLLVSSDRISAYDFVLGTPVPDKGKVLNQISQFWFDQTKKVVKNHLITANADEYPPELAPYRDQLAGRSMLVWKTEKINIECVVRGYLAGSGWKEYQQSGKVCGVPLPPGLQESQQLPEPIFTPATKEEGGKHDQNISFDDMAKLIGRPLSEQLKDISISIFNFASQVVAKKGLILADTKFEFGIRRNADGSNEVILIDEALTPDSSRFWEKDQHKLGTSPASFDKQFVRDYLDSIKWNRQPPVPTLPEDIVRRTREKYLEAFTRITGKKELS